MHFWAGYALQICRRYAVAPAPGVTAASAADSETASSEAPIGRIGEELAKAFSSARAAVANFLDLVALEARRASHALTWIIALGWVAAVCLVTSWLGLMGLLAMGVIALGAPKSLAILGVVILNIVLAIALISACIRMSHDLLFPASRRQLAGEPPVKP